MGSPVKNTGPGARTHQNSGGLETGLNCPAGFPPKNVALHIRTTPWLGYQEPRRGDDKCKVRLPYSAGPVKHQSRNKPAKIRLHQIEFRANQKGRMVIYKVGRNASGCACSPLRKIESWRAHFKILSCGGCHSCSSQTA